MRSHCACCSAVGTPSGRISESWFTDSIAVQPVSASKTSRAYRGELNAITEFGTRAMWRYREVGIGQWVARLRIGMACRS
jgi:hypothetical protein